MAKVGFIGLGIMGAPMARHLKAKGHELTVYNRTTARAEKWVSEHGGTVASTPRQAAEGQEFVFACVGNDDDLRQVTIGQDGAFEGLGKGAIFVDHTTASAEVARELHEAARQRDADFIDAPVSGGQAGAENGVLTVMCGGDSEPYAKAEPVIASFARACRLMGPSGSGQLTKMINQICIAGVVQGLAEGIHFGQQAGLEIEAVLRRDFQGRRGVVADGEPGPHHERGQVRLRLRSRLDAQGPGDLSHGSPQERRQPSRDGSRRPVLRRRTEERRKPLGHIEPDFAFEAIG